MTEYVVAAPFVELAPEMVVELDPEQANRCRLVVTRLSDTTFKLLQPIHFKQGERLGLADCPKGLRAGLRPLRTEEGPTPQASPPPSLRAKGRK